MAETLPDPAFTHFLPDPQSWVNSLIESRTEYAAITLATDLASLVDLIRAEVRGVEPESVDRLRVVIAGSNSLRVELPHD